MRITGLIVGVFGRNCGFHPGENKIQDFLVEKVCLAFIVPLISPANYDLLLKKTQKLSNAQKVNI